MNLLILFLAIVFNFFFLLCLSGCADQPTYIHQCITNTRYPESFKKLRACIERGKEMGMSLTNVSNLIDPDGNILTAYMMETKIKPKGWDDEKNNS